MQSQQTMQPQQTNQQQHWTPSDREDFIDEAVNSQTNGRRGCYQFLIFPKINKTDDGETPKKNLSAAATAAFAKTTYNSHEVLRRVSLEFYNTLFQKLVTNVYIGPCINRDVFMLLKGGNAYTYVTEHMYPEDFPYSDLDIVIYINPYIEKNNFINLQKSIKVCVVQTMSQYKRNLDNLFFLKKSESETTILNASDVDIFKNVFTNKLNIENEDLVSPFTDDETRNFCSKNSFMITNSKNDDSKVVLIDIPHYDRCERIPLRRTPFFCSFNETIEFDRKEIKEGQKRQLGHFDLYRIRMNVKHNIRDDNGDIIGDERIPLDFIDVSIASQDDVELIDFWNHGRCITMYDRFANVWLSVPDLKTCINDLDKMINMYDCHESKKKKRIEKLEKLQSIFNKIY